MAPRAIRGMDQAASIIESCGSDKGGLVLGANVAKTQWMSEPRGARAWVYRIREE